MQAAEAVIKSVDAEAAKKFNEFVSRIKAWYGCSRSVLCFRDLACVTAGSRCLFAFVKTDSSTVLGCKRICQHCSSTRKEIGTCGRTEGTSQPTCSHYRTAGKP